MKDQDTLSIFTTGFEGGNGAITLFGSSSKRQGGKSEGKLSMEQVIPTVTFLTHDKLHYKITSFKNRMF